MLPVFMMLLLMASRVFLFISTWQTKIPNPCNELNTVNKYAPTSYSLSLPSMRKPRSQVNPRIGRRIKVPRTQFRTFSMVLFSTTAFT
uniref:Putative secreted protein n=1 Tax=Ixodes ricinus TaxID=34613 RepID=A0A6B0UBW2_IXORI